MPKAARRANNAACKKNRKKIAKMSEIDATGLACPMPVLRLQKALRGLKTGARVTLLASDPMAAIDVPHFLNENGHSLIARSDETGPRDMQILKFEIEKG